VIIASLLAKLEADPTNMVRNIAKGTESIDKLERAGSKAGRSITSQLTRAEGAAGKLATTLHKADQSQGKLSTSADRAEKSMKKVGDSARTTADHIGKSNTAMERFTHVGGPSGPNGGLPGVNRQLMSVADNANKSSKGLQSMVGSGMKIAAGIGVMRFFAEAVGGVKQAVLGYNQSLEQAMIGMETMLGSKSKATAFMAEIQEFAAKTPFSFQGLVSSTQSMMALGFKPEDVLPNLRAVGDATAALGGSMEDMGARVIRAMGQMQAKGKVSAEEMMQLAEAGIPAWQYLADAIGMEVPAAMEYARKTGVDSAVAIDAVMKGMAADFGGMMEAQAKTMNGAWSTVLDYLQMNVAKATKPLFDEIKNGILGIAEMLDSEEATKFADEWGKRIADGFQVVKDVATPIILDLVDFIAEAIELAVNVGGELESLFTTAGAVAMGAFKAFETFIDMMAGIARYINDNEWALKTLTTGVKMLVAAFVVKKVADFFSTIHQGVYTTLVNVQKLGRSKALTDFGSQFANTVAQAQHLKQVNDAVTDGLASKWEPATGSISRQLRNTQSSFKNMGSALISGFGVGGVVTLGVSAGLLVIANHLQKQADKAREYKSVVDGMLADIESATAIQPKEEGGVVTYKVAGEFDMLNALSDKVFEDEKLTNALGKAKINAFDFARGVYAASNEIGKLEDSLDSTNARAWLFEQGVDTFKELSEATGAYGGKWDDINWKALEESGTLKHMDALVESGMSMNDVVDTMNTYVDATSEVARTHEQKRQAADRAAEAMEEEAKATEEAAKANSKYKDGLTSIIGMASTTDKVLSKNIEAFGTYVDNITSTWQSAEKLDWEEMLSVEDLEKQMADQLKYLGDWSANLRKIMDAGASTQVMTYLIESGPESMGRIAQELANNPSRIADFNQAFADEGKIRSDVENITTQVDLMANAFGPDGNLMSALQYAEDQGIDFWKVMETAPGPAKQKVQEWIDKIAEGIGLVVGISALEFPDLPSPLKPLTDEEKTALQGEFTSDFQDVLDNMPELAYKIGIDPAGAQDSFLELVKQVADAEIGADVKVMVDGQEKIVDPMQVAAIRNLINGIETMSGGKLDIDANPDLAVRVVGWLLGQVDQSEGVLSILADPRLAQGSLREVTASIDAETGVLTIDGNKIPAESKLNYLKALVPQSGGTIMVDANVQKALDSLAAIKASITGVFDMVLPFGLDPFAEADGGIVHFANGIEQHVAQIGKKGQMRVWNEPETWGEAYIPLAPTKRGRSMKILSMVADKFGAEIAPKPLKLADGGYFDGSGSGGGTGASRGVSVVIEKGAVDARNTDVTSLTTQLGSHVGWRVSNASRRN